MTITALPLLLPAAPGAGEQRLVRCEDCHRPLHRAEARAMGRGEKCQREEFAARRFDAEQDALPGL